MTEPWILPSHFEDILPEQGWRFEEIRQEILTIFRGYGYHYIAPSLMESQSSTQAVSGWDLDELSFRTSDPQTGQNLSLRADMTLQAARIDSHTLSHQAINRLCYAGSVVHTRPEGLGATREPHQIGAELFGVTDISADLEILKIMLAALAKISLSSLTLDVGHVGIYKGLVEWGELSPDQEKSWFLALQAKDRPQLKSLAQHGPTEVGQILCRLPDWSGDPSVLEEARRLLPPVPKIHQAISQIEQVVQAHPTLRVNVDLSELRGYGYHSGLVFAVYQDHFALPVARGGRYDDIGKFFGHARPATGFSMDLRYLLGL